MVVTPAHEMHKSTVTVAKITFLRKTTKCTLLDHKRSHNIMKELKIQLVLEKSTSKSTTGYMLTESIHFDSHTLL
jgi:hypothetical protein